MKKSDMAMILLIAAASVMVAFFVANSIPVLKPSDKGEKVKTIEPITAEVAQPSDRIFNKQAINPTVETIIGGAHATQ